MTSSNEQPIPAARPVIGEAEIEAAVRVLRSGMVVQGPEVAAFEEEFSRAGRRAALRRRQLRHLRAAADPAGPGHRPGRRGHRAVVLVRRHAPTRSAWSAPTPVFADIEPGSFCLDPDAVAAAITPRTAAIMPVHLYGHPAAMDRLMALAERHGLAVVEDACQAHGAALNGTPVGAFGAAGCFSFYPTKNMHSLEGGMITTADAELARTLRLLRNQGMEQRYANEIVGANMRMTDVAAADRPGPARQAARLDRAAPRQRQVPRPRITARVRRRRSPTAPGTSTTSTRSGSPGDRDAAQASSPRRASAAPSTTRRRSTGSSRT